jgi:predicted ATPase
MALYEQIRAGEFVDKGAAAPPPVEAPAVEQPEPKPPIPSAPAHNLPAALKSFFGREEELAILNTYLQNPEIRLVTLVGMGGMGKTDLSLQAARTLLPFVVTQPGPQPQVALASWRGSQQGNGLQATQIFKDGVWFVALAGVQPPLALPGEAPEAQLERLCQALAIAIATALGLTLEGDQLPQAQVKAYLRDKALLLVVDNFEHLVEGALFIQELLLHAGQLKLLVTSRERLRLPGEWILDLEGLPYPPKLSSRPEASLPDPEAHWATAEGLKELAGFASVSLFVERARQGWAAFALSAQNSRAVVRLCQLVEGMPLGLELLASQLRGFMPEQVVQAVEGNLTRLQTDLRTVPARHRSLQAVFEWSWSLLYPTQQRLFSQLSVFRGGFEAEAAQAVVGATWPDLLELWERSLLRRHESGRLEMHELLSQFAQEKLALYETAYAGESVQDRHSYYYITLLNLWEADLLDENLKQALAECRRELDNIRQAWQWAISRDRFEWIGRSLSTIVSIYDLLGLFQEAVTILEAATAKARAREAVTTNPAEVKTLQKVWGQLLVEQSHFLYKQARYDRLAEMAQARDLERAGRFNHLRLFTAGQGRLGPGRI